MSESKPKGAVPKIVSLEVLEKNGVNIERLKELITKGVGAEFTTYYYYTILRMHCTGLEGEGIKEIAEDARIEDRNHFEAMVSIFYACVLCYLLDSLTFKSSTMHSKNCIIIVRREFCTDSFCD